MAAESLFAALERVPDFRQPGGRRHRLRSVLALAACAMLCGCRSLYAIAQWGRDHPELAPALGFRPGRTPCVATLHRVFKGLDVARFEAVLADWLRRRAPPAGPGREAVAVDGKSLRGSQGHRLPAVHLLAAYGHRLGLPLAQAAVGGKTNEHKAALPLLRSLARAGVVVTADAAFCQREVCGAVVARGGDYAVAVKDNQPALKEAIAALLPDSPPSRSRRRSS
jgi:DDE family transposase